MLSNRRGSVAEMGFTQGSFVDANRMVDSEDDSNISNNRANFVQLNTKLHNCWICENWVECDFEIDLVEMMQIHFNRDLEISENLDIKIFVYMHFDFDDYEPDKMDDLRKEDMNLKGQFRMSRMVPQGRFHYFYSFEQHCFSDPGQKSVKVHDRLTDKI